MSNLPELTPSTSVRAMLYQMAELLIYSNETDRLVTLEALSNPFLVEAPDLDTAVAQWLQFLGDDVSPGEFRATYEPQGGASPLS